MLLSKIQGQWKEHVLCDEAEEGWSDGKGRGVGELWSAAGLRCISGGKNGKEEAHLPQCLSNAIFWFPCDTSHAAFGNFRNYLTLVWRMRQTGTISVSWSYKLWTRHPKDRWILSEQTFPVRLEDQKCSRSRRRRNKKLWRLWYTGLSTDRLRMIAALQQEGLKLNQHTGNIGRVSWRLAAPWDHCSVRVVPWGFPAGRSLGRTGGLLSPHKAARKGNN